MSLPATDYKILAKVLATELLQVISTTTLFLKDLTSVEEAIELFNDFGGHSGLRLNIDKTEIVSLGILCLTENALPIDSITSVELNYTEKLKIVEKLLYMWSSRNLSWKGKITTLKSLVVPKFLHLFSSIHTPVNIFEKISKLLFNFLWNKKPLE